MIVGKERAMKAVVVPVLAPLILTLAAWGLGCSRAADAQLAVGDPAPAFSLPGSDGRTYSLEDLAGRTVVLAWFPKAFTGG